MNSKGLYDGLRTDQDKNEEMADAAAFFVGLTKEAFGLAVPCGVSGEPAKGWLSQFESSPLMQQALALERQELQMESEDIAKRQQERAESDGRMQADQQRWDMRDQIRLQKRELELQLAEQSMGAVDGGEGAIPKHEAGMTTTDVAPAEGGAEPPATIPGTGMPKIAGAGLRYIARGMAQGGVIGGAAGAVGSVPLALLAGAQSKGTTKEKFKRGIKFIPKAALGGAALGSAVGGAGRTADVVRHAMNQWEHGKILRELGKGKKPGGGGQLKNAMVKLGFATKTSSIREIASDLAGKAFNKKTIPAIIGGGLGGLYMHSRSRPRKDLEGKSRSEVESEKELATDKATGKPEEELGFSGKIMRRATEAMPGISKAFRQHPFQAALVGAAMGAQAGNSLKPLLGTGANALRKYQEFRRGI